MFNPPSIPETNETQTFTHFSNPKFNESVIAGVDEAGRGPIIGPMVYAIAFCPVSYIDTLKTKGYNDSKVLKADVRHEMFKDLVTTNLAQEIGWGTTTMSALDITAGMFNRANPYNLNNQAHDTTINLVQTLLSSGTEIAELYIDTVGPPDKYQQKLARIFPDIKKIVVAKKADALYPLVSLASICAKVTRDLCVEKQLGTDCGSGYPSDGKTVNWLKNNLDPIYGWGPHIRYSWQTADTLLNTHGHEFTWHEPTTKRKFSFEKINGLPEISSSLFGENLKI